MTETAQRVRQRITLACNGCRSKRTKCNGLRPQCGACRYRDELCEYTQAESKRKRPSNHYVAALEARVASLEERLATRSSGPRVFVTSHGSLPATACASTPVAKPKATELPATEKETPEEPDPVDELTNVLGTFTLGDAGELRFFGAASNFNLNPNYSFNDSSATGARLEGMKAASLLYDNLEVPHELRDHLLSLYWKWQNSWQYLVPMKPFLHDLHFGKTGRFYTPLLLTAMLAHASRYSDRHETRTDLDDPNTAGGYFFIQAKTMLQCEHEAPTTSTIQATALMGLYAIATDKESLGWLYVGMASRMSFSLGLHLDCSEYVKRGIVSSEDADARSVTWWGIYVLDRLFGLALGRPAGLQEYNITAAKPLIDEGTVNGILTLDPEYKSRPSPLHVSINAIHTCELFKLTSEVLDQLYARRPGWTVIERQDLIMQTHLRLVEFHDTLPQQLKLSGSALKPSQPQTYQLHIQYHVALILLHRPFARGFTQIQSSPGTPHSDKEDLHTQVCRISAEKIAHIFRVHRSNFTLRTIPISAVHGAFTAAVIHLVNIRDFSLHSTNAIHCLKILVRSLYEMNIAWNWSNRSIRAIASLAEEWKVNLGIADSDIPDTNLKAFRRYKDRDVVGPEQEVGANGAVFIASSMPNVEYQVGQDFFEGGMEFGAWPFDRDLDWRTGDLNPEYLPGELWNNRWDL